MLATSIGGAVTGKGGNHIVVDDPHTPRYAESDAVRQHAIEYFLRTLVTRLDDKRLGTIVVVMQRLHTGDLTATCLDLGYTHLCLPAVAEMRTTHPFLRSGRVVTREVGDLLWPAREGPAVIATLRHEIRGIIPVKPKGGKFERASACAPAIEAGNVYLPRPTAPNGRRIPERAWVYDFIEQLAAFPKGAHDDDVDALTQLLLRWNRPSPPGMISRMLRAGRGGPPARPRF